MGSNWKIGEVDQVIVGRDGLIRRAVIKYYNGDEKTSVYRPLTPQFTDRAVRSLVKLWSMDEACLFDDLAELQGRVDAVDKVMVGVGDVTNNVDVVISIAGYAPRHDVPLGNVHLGSEGELVDLSTYSTSF